jgi:hypothetical protein
VKHASTYLLLACFLLAAGNLASEPIKHPVTGEQGFFVSRAEMEQTVVALQERDLYLASYERAMLALESLQICSKRKDIVMVSEAVVVVVLVLLCLLK